MPYVRITADTFINGEIARKGQERKVSDYSATMLVSANKAVRIDRLKGEEVKPDLSGPLTVESVKKPAVTAPNKKPVENEVIYEQPKRDAASGRFKKRQEKGGKKR